MSAGSRTSEVGRCVRLAATSSQPLLLIAHSYCWTHCMSGNIAYGYFSDLILPIIILIHVVTLANNALSQTSISRYLRNLTN